ncbi:hypothetical protein [Streptococcus hyointestinalis]|nr:hypothetical protein [Streptococcus hyointestinalis]
MVKTTSQNAKLLKQDTLVVNPIYQLKSFTSLAPSKSHYHYATIIDA